jgi:hypothetical protein
LTARRCSGTRQEQSRIAGQAQKEFTHNEALQTLDMLVGGCVEGPPQASPPASPAIGSAYLVASGATGAWAGNANCVAAWTSGGWRFVAPTEGLQLLDRSSGSLSVYWSGSWKLGVLRANSVQIGGVQVVGARQPAISAPSGGSLVDAEARNAVSAILAALQSHGLIAP